MDIGSILTFGLPALAIVIGLVELCKKLNVNGNLCIILAIVFGVVIMIVQQLALTFPLIEPWVRAAVMGLVIGLAASGLYDWAKQFRPTKPQ